MQRNSHLPQKVVSAIVNSRILTVVAQRLLFLVPEICRATILSVRAPALTAKHPSGPTSSLPDLSPQAPELKECPRTDPLAPTQDRTDVLLRQFADEHVYVIECRLSRNDARFSRHRDLLD